MTCRNSVRILQTVSEENTQLLNVSEALECENLRPQYVHNILLVASRVRAGNELVRGWECTVLHLEKISEIWR